MNEQPPLEIAQRIHQTCKHFESAWRGAARPQLITFLAEISEPERSWLLVELLALEVELRQAAGEQPTEAEYRLLLPCAGDGQSITDAFRRCASEAEPSASAAGGSDTEQLRKKDPGARSTAIIPGKVEIEGYEILDLLGRGGMGVVYKARDLRLKRFVALKMILTGEHAGPEQLARFRAEAEMVARLQHPNIVQIHEVREERGNPCIVFEYINGQTLADFARGEPQPPRVAAELLEGIARAIQYAHEQGIVHRDLKPTNILLAEGGWPSGSSNGSTVNSLPACAAGQSSLVPKITDFGLAKDLAANLDQTASGTILGTLHYMSPEQAEGRRNIGPASDIYSLGAILYVLLTGRAPIQGTTRIETLHMVINTEPVAPSQLQPRLAKDLETICLTCLGKDPTRRYPTAGALADDLRRFLNGEPILARPVGRFERAVKWVKRNRVITGAAVAVVLALTAGATVSYLKYLDAERQWASAEERRKEAETQTKLAEKQRKEADEERETALAVSEFLGGLFEDVDPVARTGRAFGTQRRGEGALTALEVVDRGAAKLKTSLRDKPRVRAALLVRIGTVYLDLERARDAEPLLQEALQIRLVEYGPDSLEVAASRQSIGLLHMCRAEMEPAREAFEKALDLRRKHLGKDHPLVADTLFHLGIQWSSLDNFAGAEACLRESLAIRRRHFGSESREVCVVLFVMGGMYLHFGEDAKAITPLQEAAALADKLEGKNDFTTVVSLYFQAQLAEKLGNAGAARKLHKEAEVKAVKLLGADHHLVALGRTEFAEFLMRQGEFGPAVEILRDVIVVLRKSFGPESDPVATRLLILARAERGRGHVKEAEAAVGEAVQIWRKSLGGKRARPLNAATGLHVQASLVFNRRALAEADPLYREGLVILLKEKVPSFAERQHTMARDLAWLLLEREGLQVSKKFSEHTKPSGEPALDLAYAETWAKASQALLRFSQPPTVDDQLIYDHFQSHVILMLRSAVAAGLRDADAIQSNLAFKSLHGRADFQEIVRKSR